MTLVSQRDTGPGFPRPTRRFPEGSPRALLPHTWVQTQRLLRRLVRNPTALLHSLIVPVAFLIALDIVFGDSVSTLTGDSALYNSVPLVILVGVISGSTASVVAIIGERSSGFLTRLWILPVHRASGLLSRVVADSARVLMSAMVVLSAGLVMGFRFHRGAPAVLGFLSIPVIFGIAVGVLVSTIALYWSNPFLVESILIVDMVATFFCTGFLPLEQYPEWIQPMVAHQPMSYAVDAMRGFALGGPVLWPTIATTLWSVGIVAACAIPIAVGYRKASTRG
jgi:ABC-2 type transport system permease protein